MSERAPGPGLSGPISSQLPDRADLTPAQRRIFLLDRIEGGTRYGRPTVFRVAGALDPARVDAAFRAIVERHESLRTAFELRDNTASARVRDMQSLRFKVVHREGKAEDMPKLLARSARPIDVSRPPLLRVECVQLGKEDHLLCLDVHQVAADRHSAERIMEEFEILYAGGELADEAPRASDHARRLYERVDASEVERQTQFWAEQFQHSPGALDLPTDFPRPPVQRFEGSTLQVEVPTDLAQQLGNVASQESGSLSDILLAAYAIALGRFSGETEMVVGITVDGRRHAEDQALVGALQNELPLRVDADNALTFDAFYAQLRSRLAEAAEHQDVVVEELAELRLERDTSRKPLYDVSYEFSDIAPRARTFAGLTLTPVTIEYRAAHCDIGLRVTRDGQAVHLSLTHAEALFRPETIESLAHGVVEIARQVASNPKALLGDLTLLSTQQQQEVLAASAPQPLEALPGTSIVDRFEVTVQRFPEQPAVSYGDDTLSFAELNNAANRLCACLQAEGVQVGDRVGILMGRCVESIVAIVGILKAGAIYLPLTPDLPEKRIATVLQDSGTSILVSRSDVLGKFAPDHTPPSATDQLTVVGTGVGSDASPPFDSAWVLLDKAADVAHGETVENPPHVCGPNTLAYVLYTSGSSGTPKGAMIEHDGVANLVLGLQRRIYDDFEGRLRVALVAPLVFDASVQQVFATLLLGHELVIVPGDVRIDGKQLVRFYSEQGIDVSDGTPAHLGLMASSFSSQTVDIPVRHFLIGGEALATEQVMSFFNVIKGDRPTISNVYGLTECAVDSTSFRIDPDSPAPRSKTYPIGTGLPNIGIYVLDEQLRPQPCGVVGELHISGPGVGRGYLNQDDLTAETYIQNPFPEGGLLLKTGDMVRRLPDGNVEMIGRRDQQIKVRGFRLDLGEIEHQLLRFSRDSQVAGLATTGADTPQFCTLCVLSSNHPGVTFNDQGLCSVCEEFEKYSDWAGEYFGTVDSFHKVVEKARASRRGGEYDCLLLFSGGKDSSYTLYRLVEAGLKVHTFTFDNGFISASAFANIERITSKLGVDHVTMDTQNMAEIFAESLRNDSTVCNGCFRALTSLSTQLAKQLGTNMVVTGLSRGQILDTKLYGIYKLGIHDPVKVEEQLTLYRRMYHARKDRIHDLLDEKVEDDAEAFEQMYFVDYFRHDPATTMQTKQYLQDVDEYWRQPGDTGFCSSNCMINDVGISVHLKDKGYHNYAAPLSWDLRLGVETREGALEGIQEPTDPGRVESMCNKIGFTSQASSATIKEAAVVEKGEGNQKYLCAYYVSDKPIEADEIKEHLAEHLPEYMVPSRYVAVELMPLNSSGKIDRRSLMRAPMVSTSTHGDKEAPRNDVERKILAIWKDVLEIDEIGVTDEFFDLGGQSFMAAVLISFISEEFDIDVPLGDVISALTVRGLAGYVESKLAPAS